jgi:hypothetical protein
LKQKIGSKGQLCKEHEATVDHLTWGCPTLTKNEDMIKYVHVCIIQYARN